MADSIVGSGTAKIQSERPSYVYSDIPSNSELNSLFNESDGVRIVNGQIMTDDEVAETSAPPRKSKKAQEVPQFEEEDTENPQEIVDTPEDAEVPEVKDLGEPENLATVSDCYNHYLKVGVAYYLRENGVQVREDLKDLETKIREAYRLDAYGANQIMALGKTYAENVAKKYYEERWQPNELKRINKNLINFTTQFKKDFPDYLQHYKEMEAIAPKVFKEYPELKDDYMRALPIIYLRAIRGDVRAAATQVQRTKTAAVEKASARQGQKGPGSGKKDNFEFLTSFNGVKDPLAGLFQTNGSARK